MATFVAAGMYELNAKDLNVIVPGPVIYDPLQMSKELKEGKENKTYTKNK